MSFEIVPAHTQEQRDSVRMVANTTWPQCYGGIISNEQIAHMIEWMYNDREIIDSTMRGTPYNLVVAESERGTREIVGIVSFDTTPASDGTCELHKLYLLPQFWGMGIGNWTLNYVVEYCHAAGATAVWLRVNKQNLRAQKAYARAGFKNVKSVCTDIGSGFKMDDFVFRKDLRD